MTLYELPTQFKQLFDMEITEEDFTAFEALISELKDTEANKADAYGAVIASLNGEIDALDGEIKRLSAWKKTRQNKVTRMKEALELYMKERGIKNIDGSRFKLTLQKNQPALVIDDETKVPTMYKITTITFDNAAIKEGLKMGNVLDFAHLEQSETIRIK